MQVNKTTIKAFKQLKNKNVLIFGEDTRSFLSVIRSLGEVEMNVDVVTFSNRTPSLKSKYIRNRYYFNYQAYDPADWNAKVSDLLLTNEYDIAIPCDERALYPLQTFQASLNIKTRFAIPNTAIMAPLFNKVETRLIAQTCGVSVAKGALLNLTSISYNELTEQFGSPLVLKPVQSYTSEHLNQRNSVSIVKDKDGFDAFRKHYSDCLIETYNAGYGVGISILAVKGELYAAFAHERVAEPESGGGSTYRKASKIDPSMLDACQKICSKLRFDGVAMFEFKFNPDTQDWILIEINARFWGSLPLAIFAGVNFPAMYAMTLLDYPIDPKFTYNPYAYARNFTSDIYDIKSDFEQQREKLGLGKASLKLAKRLVGFTRLLTWQEKIDSFDWQDRAPFVAEFKSLFQDKVDNLPIIKNNIRKSKILDLEQVLTEPLNEILVVCYGNIMRSPFAGELLKQKLNDADLQHIKVDSYGFHQHENRSCPTECVELAKSWQLDLSSHRSKWIKQKDMKPEGQLILIFDHKNQYILEEYYEGFNAISLAALIPESKGYHSQIEDPYERNQEYLAYCYQLIDQALDNLVSQIQAHYS